jgi:hypothetical protein
MPATDLGLRFVFSRDHAFKFRRPESLDTNPVFSADRWHVAGTFDLLDVKPIHSLDELDVVRGSISTYGDLVLFPLDKTNAEKLNTVRLECATDHVFMVCLRITLSPAAYEFGSHFQLCL